MINRNILKPSYVTETGASNIWNGIKSSRLICEKAKRLQDKDAECLWRKYVETSVVLRRRFLWIK